MSEKLILSGLDQINDAVNRTLTSVEVVPTQEEQVITAPEGYNGFNEVKVKSANLQRKIVNPSKETQVITADEGYYGLSEVIVGPPVIDGEEIINKVNEISDSINESYIGGNATHTDILEGKEAFVKGKKVIGTIQKYSGVNQVSLKANETANLMLNTANKYVEDDISIEVVEEKTTPWNYFKDILDNDVNEEYPYKIMLVYETMATTINTSYLNISYNKPFRINDGEIQSSGTVDISDLSFYKYEVYDSMNQINTNYGYVILYFDKQTGTMPEKLYQNVTYIILNDKNQNAILNDRTTVNVPAILLLRWHNFKNFGYRGLDIRRYPDFDKMEISICENSSNIYVKSENTKVTSDSKYNVSYLYAHANNLYVDDNISISNFNIYGLNSKPVVIEHLNCDSMTRFTLYTDSQANSGAIYPNITEINLFNVSCTLTLGNSYNYGYNLTYDSIIHTIRELINTNSSRKLTIGTPNMLKIQDIYVKLIDITDEMIKDDSKIALKIPFAICESTDDGAMNISQYLALKNWTIG